jgi:superfamily II DNA or RNA helicase
MIQTLCVREHDPKQFESFGLVIVDEAHHIGAPAFSKTMFKMKPEYTLGLTATPDRKDGLTKILFWFLGEIFYTMTEHTEITIHKIDFDHPTYRSGPPLNKFGKVSLAHIVNHLVEIDERNALIVNLVRDAVKRNRRILILSDRRNHCEWLHTQFGDDLAGLYMGGMSSEQHTEASQKQVIVATFSLAYEGLDIPSLDTLFLVTPHSDVKQAVGRITRVPGTKEVFDIVDNWCVLQGMFYKRKRNVYDPPKPKETVGCMFNQ